MKHGSIRFVTRCTRQSVIMGCNRWEASRQSLLLRHRPAAPCRSGFREKSEVGDSYTCRYYSARFAVAADPPLVRLPSARFCTACRRSKQRAVAVSAGTPSVKTGRWMGERRATPVAAPPLLWLLEDSKPTGPKPPGDFELDAAALNRSLPKCAAHVARQIPLRPPGLRRWAVIYAAWKRRKAGAPAGSRQPVFPRQRRGRVSGARAVGGAGMPGTGPSNRASLLGQGIDRQVRYG